jgi:hypothetical protein
MHFQAALVVAKKISKFFALTAWNLPKLYGDRYPAYQWLETVQYPTIRIFYRI